MLPLLPILLQLLPTIGNWLGGSQGAAVAATVGQAVTAVTGVADPHTTDGAAAVQAALAGKPELAAQLQQKLVEIAAAQHQADLDAQTAAFKAVVADTASARQQTIDLAKSGSALAYGAPLVSTIVLATFGIVMWAALTRTLPPGSETIMNMLLGTLAAMATSTVSYWVGSSAGSAQKNDMLYRSAPPAAGGVPAGPFAR